MNPKSTIFNYDSTGSDFKIPEHNPTPMIQRQIGRAVLEMDKFGPWKCKR